MKIALVKPPGTYADWYKHPPLGISYIASCIERAGFDCKIFDAYFNRWSKNELAQRIVEYRPDAVGFTSMTHEIMSAARIASRLREDIDVPFLIGGCHVTALPSQTLKEFTIFDVGVCGEGENTIIEILQVFKQGKTSNLSSVKGIVFRASDGEVIVNEPQPFLNPEELNKLPYPAFHQYYGNRNTALAGKDSYYVIMSGRGCPYRCIFCMRVLGCKIRQRSPENVYNEIKYAINHYGAHTFNFEDEIFIYPNQFIKQLSQLLIESGLSKTIRWSGLTRVDLIRPELIDQVKKAGCFRLEMGIESGDDKILKEIGKNFTVEQAKKAVRIIKQKGISLNTYFILGHPNENLETLRKTVNLAIELNTDGVSIGIMVPYPGTKVYDMALKGEGGYRLLTNDWSEFDKYCSKVLEIAGLPYRQLLKWHKRALVLFYLRNLRFFDFIKFFWIRRKAIYFLFYKFLLRYDKVTQMLKNKQNKHIYLKN